MRRGVGAAARAPRSCPSRPGPERGSTSCAPRSTASPTRVPSRGSRARRGAAPHRPRVHDPRRRARWSPGRCGRGRSGAATSCGSCRAVAGPASAASRSMTSRVERAAAGQRVAVNLTGVAVAEVARGDVLADRRRRPAPDVPDRRRARVRAIASPGHGDRVQVHHGTRESPARLAWLGGRFWQLRLEQPLIAGPRRPPRDPPDRAAGHARRRHGARRPPAQARPGPRRCWRGWSDSPGRAGRRPSRDADGVRPRRPPRRRRRDPPRTSHCSAQRPRRSSPACARPASSRRSTPSSIRDDLAALRDGRARSPRLAGRSTTTPTCSPTSAPG